MTALADILIRRITENGPISLADYMAECLLHPEHGYYATRDPFGAAGDFTTAPEISQMFGELIGLCLAQTWVDQGSPEAFTLAELGPGRGTMMADILRATGAVPGFQQAARVHLVEASQTLRQSQRNRLCGSRVTWKADVATLPEAPLYLIANEFFDALPIRQFRRDPAGWREHQVGLRDGGLGLGLTAPMPVTALDRRLADTRPGDVVETCAPANSIIQVLAGRIADYGGAAVIIDYGDWRSLGDTFQALKQHSVVDPFVQPGEVDLTAHVDFEALSKASQGVAVSALTPQGVLLERLGIAARAQALAKNLSGAALHSHIAAHRRLTHPDEMGSLFKAIALHPIGSSPPPGFVP